MLITCAALPQPSAFVNLQCIGYEDPAPVAVEINQTND